MTCETPTIRPLRRTDFPALEELIRLAWYDDGNDSHNTHDECQDRRQRQSAGSLNELGSLLQMKSAPLNVLLR